MDITPDRSALNNGEVVLPVSALTRSIALMLERNFSLAWIAGEISNFTQAASGHWYFLLKDASAQIRCVMFRSRTQNLEFVPRNGDRIEVRALATLYEARGELQLNVEHMRRTGQGQLYEAFLQLKAKLTEEGLFDVSKKRPLPAHPRTIGVVTSLQAAALRDVLSTLARRAPHVSVIIYPAPVQGVGAAAQLVAALENAQRRAEVDVLIICRGGGSLEDLWEFNHESLARAIASSNIPIISGVGHETDFTIADFVADMRAPTPTGAAELVSTQRDVLLRELMQSYGQLGRAFNRILERRMQQLDGLARCLVSPAERFAQQRSHLRQLTLRLATAGKQRVRAAHAHFALLDLRWRRSQPDLTHARAKLKAWANRLAASLAKQHQQRRATFNELATHISLLNPQHTFERGYAALLDPRSGRALRSPKELVAGKRVLVHLAQGSAEIRIGDAQATLNLTSSE